MTTLDERHAATTPVTTDDIGLRPRLMYRDRDVNPDVEPPSNAEDLIADLGLDPLLDTMGADDDYLRAIARTALLDSIDDPDTIRYRQHILADTLREPDAVHALYDTAVQAIDDQRKVWWSSLVSSPTYTLHRSIEVMDIFVTALKKLRAIADQHAHRFRSDGLTHLVAMLDSHLSDAYFDEVADHLKRLRFRNGVLLTARLGAGLAGTDYVLRRPPDGRPNWLRRLLPGGPVTVGFTIPERDEAGGRALADLRGRGINHAANALAQATDHILSFFQLLRAELGFYLGGHALHTALAERGGATCMPTPTPVGSRELTCRGLYDPGLRLRGADRVVGNDLDADGASLVLITGANQGGKSTFLRAAGIAHLMLQCGLFVPADAFTAAVTRRLFTHYKREEDATMASGKLDEELARLSDIADAITPGCLLLSNESFAATNESEGSEIGRQVLHALLECGVRVLIVTHLYDLAHSLHEHHSSDAVFLRAQRDPDGHRSFRLLPAEPLDTSYGQDLYQQIFTEEVRP